MDGFKNLLELSIDFGTFTCIAGENGTGKSNVFDAIQFLSLLAERSLIEAAQEDDLLFADTAIRKAPDGRGAHALGLRPLVDPWRAGVGETALTRADILPFRTTHPRCAAHPRGQRVTVPVVFLGEGTNDSGIVPHIEAIGADHEIEVSVTDPDLDRLPATAGQGSRRRLDRCEPVTRLPSWQHFVRGVERGLAAACATRGPG